MSAIPISIAATNETTHALVAGKLTVLVVTLGKGSTVAPLRESAVTLELPDGAILDAVLLDGEGSDAAQLGSSGMVNYYVASGGRFLLECLIPDAEEITPHVEIRRYDPALMFLGARTVASVTLAPIGISRHGNGRPTSMLSRRLGTVDAGLLASSNTYDLFVTTSGQGSGFSLHRSVGGVDYGRELGLLNLTPEVLSLQIDAAKARLDAESRRYAASIDEPTAPLRLREDRARRHCYEIARIGRELYDDVLWKDMPPNANSLLATFWKEIQRLPEGARLKIHNDGLVVPWNIVFDRELPVSAEEFTVEDVEGFWGYRYRIEESLTLASGYRLRGRSSPKRALCAYVDPTLGTDNKALEGVAEVHREILRASIEAIASPLSLLPEDVAAVLAGADPLVLLEQAIRPPDPKHLLYFLCHAKASRAFDEKGIPKRRQGELRLTSAFALTDREIREWGRRWVAESDAEPVVFLNCCEAGQMDPYGFSGLVEGFLTYLIASAVVACSWEVPAHFAHGFAERFFSAYLTDEAPSLGETMHRLRRETLDTLNPFSLVYAVYGDASVSLPPGAAAAAEMPGDAPLPD